MLSVGEETRSAYATQDLPRMIAITLAMSSALIDDDHPRAACRRKRGCRREPRWTRSDNDGIIGAVTAEQRAAVQQVVTGTFEIHIFVMPLDPSPEIAQRFTDACGTHMKGLLLRLDYENKGFVGVLQTSRYVRGSLADAIAAADVDADILTKAGFEVVRKKVEAVATNDGVPQNASDAQHSPADRYFEFHLLIHNTSGEPISNDQVVSLRSIAESMRDRLKQPVPLSYNALKPGQRFLNLRARGVGLEDAMVPVRDLQQHIKQAGTLDVVKVISEYICFDTNRAIDNGWLEPLLPS